MKAVAIQRFGGPEGLAVIDLPDPSPGDGQVLIATEAIGGGGDAMIRSGALAAYGFTEGHVLGGEVAGTVAAVGDGVDTSWVGRRGTTTGPAPISPAAALFRTLVADRRLLILLDNAATPAQVRPSLPGSRQRGTLAHPQRAHLQVAGTDTPPLAEGALRWLDEHRRDLVVIARQALTGPADHIRLGVGLILALHLHLCAGADERPDDRHAHACVLGSLVASLN
jgi:hypothetical protein